MAFEELLAGQGRTAILTVCADFRVCLHKAIIGEEILYPLLQAKLVACAKLLPATQWQRNFEGAAPLAAGRYWDFPGSINRFHIKGQKG